MTLGSSHNFSRSARPADGAYVREPIVAYQTDEDKISDHMLSLEIQDLKRRAELGRKTVVISPGACHPGSGGNSYRLPQCESSNSRRLGHSLDCMPPIRDASRGGRHERAFWGHEDPIPGEG